jgi:hypothetical protein
MIRHAKSWCPYCRGMYKTIKDMQALAAKRGGKCLSEKYIDSVTKLKWICAKGHIWKSAPCNIINNCWCPTCGYELATEKQKDSIEKYRKIARQRGGKLLSKAYLNNRTPMLWECKKGHRWKARGANVLHMKAWCPYCYGNVRKTIEDMHNLAAKKNGKCLSKKYINTYTPLKWECRKRHVWSTPPGNISTGSWCPECYRISRQKSSFP